MIRLTLMLAHQTFLAILREETRKSSDRDDNISVKENEICISQKDGAKCVGIIQK